MGNDHLRVIAHELLSSLKSNASVDWQHQESARGEERVLVKRILRKHGYPPDLQGITCRPSSNKPRCARYRGQHDSQGHSDTRLGIPLRKALSKLGPRRNFHSVMIHIREKRSIIQLGD